VRALNIAVLVFGASTGWLAGILLSPYDPKEERAFPRYAAAASAFASGYLVSKVDRVLEDLLKPEFLFSSVAGFRLLAGAVSRRLRSKSPVKVNERYRDISTL
jgi:hypothetical protein